MDGIDAFPAGSAALKSRENLVKTGSCSALYSDIDFFGHMNNARYIQWIQDATDIEVLTNASQIRFDINYLSEVLPGETVELWQEKIESDSVENENKADYPKQAGPGFAYEGRGRVPIRLFSAPNYVQGKIILSWANTSLILSSLL